MPLGVFTSIGAGLGAGIEKVVGLGIRTVQIHAPGPDGCTPERAEQIAGRFAESGVDVTVVYCGFAGESYASIPVVRETVGLVPPATRQARLAETLRIADFTSWMGVPAIGIHVGFVSEDWRSDEFADVVDVLRTVCGHCADLGLRVHLETGQETADTLLQLLETVDRENLAVNFDPANMILYGSGEPLEALRKVGAFVRSCHAKDGTWSDQPGVEWGREVPLGQGDVNIEQFVATLNEIGYDGPLTIEREISGEKQIEDIRVGIEYLAQVKARLGIA
ncbi:MAG: sugar phosphate isomerase/epimerase [Candidatus Brocadiaceae bacterium]|nr:sugar phosphate isomerase/epimerase [Candidatus Brocadiaceae bacterium]